MIPPRIISPSFEQVKFLEDAASANQRERKVRTTKEQREEWEKYRGCGMTSAVGEYTPGEFWELIDDVELLELELAAANRRAEENLQLAEKAWIDTAITSLRERLASMQTDLDAAVKRENTLQLKCDELQTEVNVLRASEADAARRAGAAEADAKRYRWLLRPDANIGTEPFIARISMGSISRWTGFAAEEAIDEAMRNG